MRKKLIILIFISAVGLLTSINIVNASRPASVLCPFEGEVINFEETTNSIDNIEQFKLTLKILSHEFVPLGEGYTRNDGIKDWCYHLDNATISGTWYTPGQNYTKNQPDVDKDKILVKNSIIKGEIDSYDNIIKNVSLVQKSIKNDAPNITNQINSDNIVDKNVKYFYFFIPILFLAGFLIYKMNIKI